jgi:hypothetical protein
MVSNLCRLTHHHTRSMIDKETLSDVGPRMDVDPGQAVGMFRHNTRDQGDTLMVKLMSHTIDRDGVKTRIAEYYLIIALSRGVAFIDCPDILGEQGP